MTKPQMTIWQVNCTESVAYISACTINSSQTQKNEKRMQLKTFKVIRQESYNPQIANNGFPAVITRRRRFNMKTIHL